MWSYTLLPKILNMSLTGSFVIVLVLLIRLPLRKAPKIFSYALWVVVLFRLLCPVSFSSDFSLLNLFNSPTVTENSITYIPTDIAHNANQQVNLPIFGASNTVNDALTQSAGQIATNPFQEPMAIATLSWLAGITAMLLYSVILLLKLRRKLTGAVKLCDNIYLADHIATPFVIGVIRSRIYLPSTLSERERDYIILHEQTHIRRLDHIVKLIAFLALSIHWFNPLVWIAFMCCMKDMEMSCDEAVMKKMGDDIRADYSASLLSLATGRKILASAPLAFGEGDTKNRIKNVLSYRKPALWIIIVAVIACITTAICLLSNPKGNDDTTYENASTEQLFKYRTAYVGDNSAVANIVGLLDFPSDVAYDHIELQTDLEPYGVEVYFSVTPEVKAAYDTSEPENIDVFRKDACVMLSLIENADYVTFCLDDGMGNPFDLQFNREWAESIVGADLWVESGSAKKLDSLMTRIGEHVESAYASADTQTNHTDTTAAEQALAVLDSVVSGETVAMTLTAADSVGGGRYEVPFEFGNGRSRVSGFDSSFNWSYAESGTTPSPAPAYSLKVESPDGTAAIQCWQGSDLVSCTLDGKIFWLSAGVLSSDAAFDGTIFTYLRIWYDEAEISGLRGDIVIPDEGQSNQEIAQEWADAYENAMLRTTPGSNYACTYVKTTASINEDANDSWYPEKALKTEHFYFDYSTVFVPENDRAKNWMMAGNTLEYTGSDAPDGALKYFHMGPMYLTEEGWLCDGAGTGP